jgi:hypothetical protein
MSGMMNKIKEAVKGGGHHQEASEGSHGPHNSRVANAADPRVDSDRDHSRTMGTGMGTGRTAGHGEYGSGTGGYGTSTGASEGAYGPHSSRLANAADPRVDSDRDNSRTVGGMGSGTHTSHTAGSGPMGMFGSTSTHGTSEGAYGPHSSRMANAADPRVDSDRDNSRTVGGTGAGTGFGTTGTSSGFGGLGSSTHATHTGGTSSGFGTHGAGSGATGMTGTHGATAGTYGPHGSRMANAADPRVDSDRDGRGALGTGPGPAPNTAGPHKSDMANKMDPRVDSDLDGSKTMGGNKTYQ